MKTDNIKCLLDKYFAGETSLGEEQQLKNYFSSGEVNKEFACYTPLFACFEEEHKVKAPVVNITPEAVNKPVFYSVKLRQLLYVSAGIAAGLLLALIITKFNKTEEKPKPLFEMYVNGERIYDERQAIAFVQQELTKVQSSLNNNTVMLNKAFNQVGESLKPLRTIGKEMKKIDEQLKKDNNINH